MTTSVQCPKCGRPVAVAGGASRAQCFGCGSAFDVSPGAPQNVVGGVNDRGWIGGLGIAVLVGLVLSIAAVTALWMLTSGDPPVEPAPPPVSAPEPSTSPPPPPPITATEQQRQLAAAVPADVRQRIIQMYDQLISSTDKKIPAMEGSYARTATENMLQGIVDREITTMAALLQVDEPSVRAVIQVELADRDQRARE